MTKQDHGDCVEHVKVAGYKKKVCILTGQDRGTMIDFAVELTKVRRG